MNEGFGVVVAPESNMDAERGPDGQPIEYSATAVDGTYLGALTRYGDDGDQWIPTAYVGDCERHGPVATFADGVAWLATQFVVVYEGPSPAETAEKEAAQ